jgi:hypothetical protein
MYFPQCKGSGELHSIFPTLGYLTDNSDGKIHIEAKVIWDAFKQSKTTCQQSKYFLAGFLNVSG